MRLLRFQTGCCVCGVLPFKSSVYRAQLYYYCGSKQESCIASCYQNRLFRVFSPGKYVRELKINESAPSCALEASKVQDAWHGVRLLRFQTGCCACDVLPLKSRCTARSYIIIAAPNRKGCCSVQFKTELFVSPRLKSMMYHMHAEHAHVVQ